MDSQIAQFKNLNSIQHLDNKNADYKKIIFKEVVHSALDVSKVYDCPTDEVLKTLVFVGNTSVVIAVVGGDYKVDIDKLCSVSEQGSLRMAKPAEVLQITSYKVGTVSPFGITGNVIKIMDNKVTELSRVITGSGEGQLLLELPIEQLLKAWDGKFGDISFE